MLNPNGAQPPALDALVAAANERSSPAPVCDWLPLYDKILVRREKPREAYDPEGKIVVAETHQTAQNRGRVLQVGEGRRAGGHILPLKVRVGMEVLFGKHSGTDLEDFPDLVILREDELLAYREV